MCRSKTGSKSQKKKKNNESDLKKIVRYEGVNSKNKLDRT